MDNDQTPVDDQQQESASADDQQSATPDPVSFLDGLDDEHRTYAEANAIEEPGDAFRQLVAMEAQLGLPKDRVLEFPRDDDEQRDEKMNAILTRLGRPAEASEYELPKDAPMQFADDAERDDVFKTIHGLGLSQKQFEGALALQATLTQKADERAERESDDLMKESEAELQKDWGKDYEANVAMVQAFVKTQDDKFVDFLESSGAGNNPAFIRHMHEFAQATQEPGTLEGLTERGEMSLRTPTEIEEELVQFEKQNRAALTEPGHQDNARVVKRRLELMEELTKATTSKA